MFTHTTSIHLHDTDAAGRLYFANQLRLAHEAYEHFMASIGFGIPELLAQGRWALPIVKAEADYKAPLRIGTRVDIHLRVLRVGKSSFTIAARFVANGVTTGHVTTVHAAVSLKDNVVHPLPTRLRTALLKAAH